MERDSVQSSAGWSDCVITGSQRTSPRINGHISQWLGDMFHLKGLKTGRPDIDEIRIQFAGIHVWRRECAVCWELDAGEKCGIVTGVIRSSTFQASKAVFPAPGRLV